MINIAIFASGTGSNFIAIHDAVLQNELNVNISVLVSDKPDSIAVKNAERKNIKTFTFKPKEYKNKREFEQKILDNLKDVDLIILAGYMRIIGPTLLSKYENRILNIHPSLLPMYKGMDAVGQALKDNATITGVTVHYVDSGMDTGSIIKQESLTIYPNETRESLEKRIHQIEHKLYKKVIKEVIEEIS